MHNFSVSFSVDHTTGRLLAVYFGIRSGKSHKTVELANGRILADYDRKGTLIGIEIIGPCSAKILDQIDVEDPVKEFVKSKMPREFIKGNLPRLTSLVS